MNGHALVVDDDPVSRLVVQHVMQREGWQVVTAGCVAEALDEVTALVDPPDVVICDYQMPGGSGLELFEALVERKVTAPFLLLTGIADEADFADTRVADIAGFLTKPVHSASLLEAVASALEPEPASPRRE